MCNHCDVMAVVMLLLLYCSNVKWLFGLCCSDQNAVHMSQRFGVFKGQ
jgi:hypothetical protein